MERAAIVTGGTGGLGSAVVEWFLDAGWRVVVPWLVEKELSRLPERDGLELVHADLFDPASVGEVVAAATAQPDAPLKAVVNLVGGFAQGGRVHETPIDEFEAQFRLNLRPAYLVSAAALPHLMEAGGGAIVCVSTRAALRPFSGAAGYISSKRAVLALVEALAAEYRDDGVRANAVLPSVIDTPGNRASQPDADYSKWVKPAEIAEVIRFLCSDESAVTSGAAIPVYGRAETRPAMASYAVNPAAVKRARALIAAQQYVLDSDWGDVQPSAERENEFLESHSWDEYAEWHLGLTDGASDGTKARHGFVYGDFRRLHRSGLIACHYRAAEWRHKEIELAAHELLQALDEASA